MLSTGESYITVQMMSGGSVVSKTERRISAIDEARIRSCWPGEEQKCDFHSNLTNMRYFNSPEVAANMSIGINPDRTLLVHSLVAFADFTFFFTPSLH